jgi:hypothetical protein
MAGPLDGVKVVEITMFQQGDDEDCRRRYRFERSKLLL